MSSVISAALAAKVLRELADRLERDAVSIDITHIEDTQTWGGGAHQVVVKWAKR